MKVPRIYIDTSVFGGCLDEEFSTESQALLDMAKRRTIVLLISDLLGDELLKAPQTVRGILAALPEESLLRVAISPEAERLRDLYLEANVVNASSAADALHVALATVARADMIVSWNFKHIVHFTKIRGFNAVNLREGYAVIEFHSPREVV